jgi:transposase
MRVGLKFIHIIYIDYYTNLIPLIIVLNQQLMNKKQTGRPVDLSGINIQELHDWVKTNKSARKILICQAIIALDHGTKMTEICSVLDTTREGVRLWKNKLREEGLKGLLKERKVGKRSKLNQQRKSKLKKIIKKSPETHGYKNKKKWTGLLIQDYARKEWGLDVSLRTAQLWLSRIR